MPRTKGRKMEVDGPKPQTLSWLTPEEEEGAKNAISVEAQAKLDLERLGHYAREEAGAWGRTKAERPTHNPTQERAILASCKPAHEPLREPLSWADCQAIEQARSLLRHIAQLTDRSMRLCEEMLVLGYENPGTQLWNLLDGPWVRVLESCKGSVEGGWGKWRKFRDLDPEGMITRVITSEEVGDGEVGASAGEEGGEATQQPHEDGGAVGIHRESIGTSLGDQSAVAAIGQPCLSFLGDEEEALAGVG